MKYLRFVSLRYIALLALLAMPLAYSQAEVRVGIGVGFGGYAAGPPVCPYGYYADYPYGCAPYGYYGPSWFANGIFIGAGPWYGWGRPYYGGSYGRGFEDRFEGRRFEGRGFDGRGFDGQGFERHAPAVRGGFEGRGSVGGFRGGFHGGSRGRR